MAEESEHIQDKADAARRLLSIRGVLDEFSSLFRPRLCPDTNRTSPQWQSLNNSLRFGIVCLDANVDILRGSGNGQCCLVICRAFFETSARVLWATRAENGFLKLQQYYAESDLKWAREALELRPDDSHAETIRSGMEEVVSRADQAGNAVTKCPDLKSMLLDIERKDSEEGEDNKNFGLYQYAYIYRLTSRIVHGHPVALRRGMKTLERHVVAVAGLSCFNMIRAFCYSTDPTETDLAREQWRSLKPLVEYLAT